MMSGNHVRTACKDAHPLSVHAVEISSGVDNRFRQMHAVRMARCALALVPPRGRHACARMRSDLQGISLESRQEYVKRLNEVRRMVCSKTIPPLIASPLRGSGQRMARGQAQRGRGSVARGPLGVWARMMSAQPLPQGRD